MCIYHKFLLDTFNKTAPKLFTNKKRFKIKYCKYCKLRKGKFLLVSSDYLWLSQHLLKKKSKNSINDPHSNFTLKGFAHITFQLCVH